MPIVPDTKNWTWVLERPCPECGFDASTAAFGDVAGITRESVAAWATVLERDDVRVRPDENTWSALEYAAHVRDVFRVSSGRLRLMLDEDDPTFEDWDQDATAVEERYGEQNPAEVFFDLRDAGLALADAFEQVPESALGRTGRRSDGSAFTIDTLARYYIHDPVHHLWDVRG